MSKKKVDWSPKIYRYAASFRAKGWTWDQIAVAVASKFCVNVSGDMIRRAMAPDRAGYEYLSQSIKNTRAGIGEIKKDRNIKHQRLILTAAEPSARHEFHRGVIRPVPITHQGMMKSIETFLSHNKNSDLYVIPMRAHVKPLHSQPNSFDHIIMQYRNKFVTDLTVNGNLKIFDAQINPQQIQPLTGMHHITGKANGYLFSQEDSSGAIGRYVKNQRSSIIIAHPKQMMEVMPNGKTSLPRLIHSTGTATQKQYIVNKMGRVAGEQHVMGGLIVDIIDDYFFLRQFQCNPRTGEFVDLGFRYHPDGKVTEERAVAMSMGDLHAGEHDEVALSSGIDMINELQPDDVFWHDIFSSRSISHHLMKKLIERVNLPPHFKTLEAEGVMCSKVLDHIVSSTLPDTQHHIVDGSNHNQHLSKWLEESRYIKQDHNAKLGHKLWLLMAEGYNPLRALVDNQGRDPMDVYFTGEYDSKFNWIGGDEDFWIEEVQYGEHGHVGIQGGFGNKGQHYVSYGKAVVGHTHRPGIYNGVYQNGTMTKYKIGYNDTGPITWLHAHTVQYAGGHRQMLIEIDGHWKG